MYSMGQGSSINGGDAGPATSGDASAHGSASAGGGWVFSGGMTVGDYYARGAQVQQGIPMLWLGAAVLVGLWLWKRKK